LLGQISHQHLGPVLNIDLHDPTASDVRNVLDLGSSRAGRGTDITDYESEPKQLTVKLSDLLEDRPCISRIRTPEDADWLKTYVGPGTEVCFGMVGLMCIIQAYA
jgi:hypothetical protein